ncbi:CbiM family transporter [Alkaliphilus transvaalensis]|uniref:CbiM family transporter n=1 Tax=Alkaliphilus transvaalensis TaxID=114628 RepID=UPI0009FFBD7D|nr:CbiM family transporter [Alkaliphilus transvaalensis]
MFFPQPIFMKGGFIMHLSDGVVSMPIVVASSAVAGGMLLHSTRRIKEVEIPKISLLSGSFFVLSLISLPVGPTSIHPLLAGLLGIMLGGKAIVAIFIGLLLQATLFQHGGISTIGVNTLLLALPALVSYYLFSYLKVKSYFLKGLVAGMMGVIGCVLLLITVLYLSSHHYSGGFFSVIRLILVGYIPLVFIEGLVTGFAVAFISKSRPKAIASL